MQVIQLLTEKPFTYMGCEKYDTAFRNAEQQISKDIVEKKFKMGQNAYWGKVRDGGMFPTKSGTRIKKVRLSRIGFGQMTTGWTYIQDDGCFSNLCAEPEAEVISHGSEESFYTLERFKVATSPICLSLIPFRQMGDREMAHFEASLKTMSQYFWNEYLRSRYINACENKYIAVVDESVFVDAEGDPLLGNDVCDTLERRCSPNLDNGGFIFWNRGSLAPVLDTTFAMDERFVSVNILPSQIHRISELSADIIEQAAINLQYEDENMPFLDQGIALMDVIVPDVKVGRRMAQLERIQESECMPQVMFPGKDLGRNLGIKRVIREMYGVRVDPHGMKFYPDDAYNVTKTDGAYDPANPSTWPRFQRVFAYVPAQNANGTVKYVPSRSFQNAPFGISVIFTPTVMQMLHHPEAQSYGSATKGDLARNYGGEVRWINEYDKKCNPKKEIGHYELHFGAGIEPDRPENGNAFFHRIDHSISLSAVRCPVSILGCTGDDMTNFCYTTLTGSEGADRGITASSRGANTVSVMNSQKFFI